MKQILNFELAAKQTIEEFFDVHSLDEADERIWRLLVDGFSTQEQYWLPQHVSDTVFFCKNVSRLLKKLHVIHEELKGPAAGAVMEAA